MSNCQNNLNITTLIKKYKPLTLHSGHDIIISIEKESGFNEKKYLLRI